jgi:hypothetical protein
MIWYHLMESWPGGHIHPHYSGQGTDGRHYRPLWHAVKGVTGHE